MVDLSLSGLDNYEESTSESLSLVCPQHKRGFIAMCIDEGCNHKNSEERFMCPICLAIKNQHINHQIVSFNELNSILNSGLNQLHKSLTQQIRNTCEVIIDKTNNFMDFVDRLISSSLQKYQKSFDNNINLTLSTDQNELLKLMQFINSAEKDPLNVVLNQSSQKLKRGVVNDLSNNFEKLQIEIRNIQFLSELSRYDIDTQIVHNLSKETIGTYQLLQNELKNVFSEASLENNEDYKLYLVNDDNFYSLSNFNSEGQRHGRSVEIPALSHFFQGYVQNGQRYGPGIYIYKDGSAYVGEFKENKKCGFGKFTSRDGYSYEGEWENDAKQGVGKESFDDECYYEGFFNENLREGVGNETRIKEKKVIQRIYEKGVLKLTLSIAPFEDNIQPIKN